MKSKKKQNPLIRLAAMTKPIAHWLLVAAVLDILAVITAVMAPELLGDLVQQIYNFWVDGCSGSIRHQVGQGLMLLLLIYGANAVFSYCNMWLMNNVVTRFFTSGIRIRISEKLRMLPVGYVDQTPVGEILSRMTQDVSTLGGYVHDIFNILVKGGFQLLMISVAMFLEDWRLACFVVVLTPLSIWLSTRIAALSETHFDAMFAESGKLTELVEEAFTNFSTAKAYHLEEYCAQNHADRNRRLAQATAKGDFMSAIVQPIIKLSNSVAYILINLIGGYLAIREGVDVGVVVTIVLFARQFASPLEQLAYSFAQINRVKTSAGRVFEILDREEEHRPRQLPQGHTEGCIEFRNVSFSYDPNVPLIQDLNLCVKPGQKVAIVGPTGAGKTTLVNLLMRFYDVTGGSILLDGEEVSQLSRDGVRDRIGMVLQDTWLFQGTIRENVRYGKPGAAEQEIRSACCKAYCDHFIRTMPDGYGTVIAEDTTSLSGGQRQLLTIARALLADKSILILDEATSNVDTRTELLIQKAMDQLMEGKTCFIIAHRLSTIVDADLILVMNQGRIVEQGTHAQLLARHGFYHKLYTSQYAG